MPGNAKRARLLCIGAAALIAWGMTGCGGDDAATAPSDGSRGASAAGVARAFFIARAKGDWSAACAYMSAEAKALLAAFASGSEGGEAECSAFLAGQGSSSPAALRQEATRAGAGSLHKGQGRARLIYRATSGRKVAMPMTRESHAWKVASLTPARKR